MDREESRKNTPRLNEKNRAQSIAKKTANERVMARTHKPGRAWNLNWIKGKRT